MTREASFAPVVPLNDTLTGLRILGVHRPDAWSMGLRLASKETLGFCWAPGDSAVGLCGWAWPRGRPEEVLVKRLKGGRITGVEGLPGEAILLVHVDAAPGSSSLVWEPLGRSGNALLLDDSKTVLWSGRVLRGTFRTGAPGSEWRPPPPAGTRFSGRETGDQMDLLEGGPRRLGEGLVKRGRAAAMKVVSRRAKALERRRKAVLADRAEGEEWAALESAAKALLSSGRLHRRGLDSLTVTDYTVFPPAELPVTLDPAKTVFENAVELFRRVRKGRRRLSETVAVLKSIEREGAVLREARETIENCTDLAVLYPSAGGTIRKPPRQPRRALPPGVAAVPLPSGFEGFAGKNAAGNDTVSFKIGRGADFWFHAEDYTGCHVVVKNPRREESLPRAVEEEAARYAAKHSGAPGGNKLAVTVSRCKFLRKIRGEPGRVMISSHRTIFVDLP